MRLLIIWLLTTGYAGAVGLWWDAVTVDIYGNKLAGAVTYQIYRDGEAYGAILLSAPTEQAAYPIPACEGHTWEVSAFHRTAQSARSNLWQFADCAPAAPTLNNTETRALQACKAERIKFWASGLQCQTELSKYKAKSAQ